MGLKKRWNCDRVDENGERMCRRLAFDEKSGKEYDTGEFAVLAVDPNSCKPMVVDFKMSEGTMKELSDQILSGMVSGCKREKGLA